METRAKIQARGSGEAWGIGQSEGKISCKKGQTRRGFTLVEVSHSVIILIVEVLAITSTTPRLNYDRRMIGVESSDRARLKRVLWNTRAIWL